MRSCFSHVLLGRSLMEDRDEPGRTAFATHIKIIPYKIEKAPSSMRINAHHSRARYSFPNAYAELTRGATNYYFFICNNIKLK